jgi:outer membrane biosynthesis protein TonB
MSDSAIHFAAGFGTLLVTAALTASVTIFHAGRVLESDFNLAEMESIEASLAYKKSDPAKKQPQKKFRAPVPEEQPEGVSRDETKTPVDDKKDEPKRKPDENFEDQYKKFQRQDDEELQAGKPIDDIGAFDGSELGFAEETRGDPYNQALVADLLSDWSYPEILSGAGVPVGCVLLSADGKVVDVELVEKSGDESLDDSVERALTSFKKRRNQDPKPVPTHLLGTAAKRPTCYRFKLNK